MRATTPKTVQPLEFYEVWVEGEPRWRELVFDRAEADGVAKRIAEDELLTVEVRPIGPGDKR